MLQDKMFRDKKGIELSMNMIIITVLGLLVLLVMAFFVYKGVVKTNDSLLCKNNNGECFTTECTDPYSLPAPQFTCEAGKRCCTKFGG